MGDSGTTWALGAVAALAAGAAWSGRRGERNVSPKQERKIYRALFPEMKDLNKAQLEAMKNGKFIFPWGGEADNVTVYTLSQMPVRREVRSKPITKPTVRGPRFKKHRLQIGPIERGDYIEPGIAGGVLALEDGIYYEEYYLPGDLVELKE